MDEWKAILRALDVYRDVHGESAALELEMDAINAAVEAYPQIKRVARRLMVHKGIGEVFALQIVARAAMVLYCDGGGEQ